MERFHSDGNINISDVIEVLQTTDPGFVECSEGVEQERRGMISGGGVEAVKAVAASGSRSQPRVEIVEQPASKALRFRYECEGRSAGSIPGVNSTSENKTFPSIRIIGYKGRAVVVVSCVTKEVPHRPHPHNLVGKEGCKRGVCTLEIASENMTVTFANLGIQCVKKKDIEEALRIREEIRVDPFRTGFEHKRQPTSIDLNAVRLCFQVFLEGAEKGKFTFPLPPVVSDPIYDKKAMSDLVICKLSTCSASVAGSTEMILLCEKVAKEDIQVRFFEEQEGQVIWEGFGDFQPTHVHKQVAIAFRTPSYRMQQVDQPVQVYIQLKRPSDGATSEPLPFQLLPLGSDDPDSLRRKRQKFNNGPSALVLRHVQAEAEKHGSMMNPPPIQYNFNLVKPEPVDRGSSAYGSPYGGGLTAGGGSPMFPVANTSPQPSVGMQTLGIQASSPGRTPSPMEYTPYNIPLMQPQHSIPQDYQSHHNPQLIPHTLSNTPHHHHHQQQQQQQQQITYLQHHQQQSHLQSQQQMMLNRVKPEQTSSFQQSVNPVLVGNVEAVADVSSVLDMDSQKYSFDLSLNQLDTIGELDLFGASLSQELSSGLSISDPITSESGRRMNVDAANTDESSNMTDSFITRLTNNTIRDLCTLNNMYKPTRENAD